MGFVWLPLGEKEGNFGLVNIGSDPGFAFIERITNALDALIDGAARRAPPAIVAELSSPRAAVAALFAIPEGRTIHLAPERQAQHHEDRQRASSACNHRSSLALSSPARYLRQFTATPARRSRSGLQHCLERTATTQQAISPPVGARQDQSPNRRRRRPRTARLHLGYRYNHEDATTATTTTLGSITNSENAM